MGFKNILLHLTEDPRNDVRSKLAVKLAADHDSHLTALFVINPPEVPVYVMAYIPADVIERQLGQSQAAAARAREALEALCRRQGVALDWCQVEGDSRDLMVEHSRYADLVIVGQPGVGDENVSGTADLPEQTVMGAGRPVLTVPYAGRFPTVGERVLVAWNGSREATRAVYDAMPLLKRAKGVTVFIVNPDNDHHIPGTGICTQLARHGVKAEAYSTVAHDIAVGDALLSALSDRSIDLLVMGAYGHSRLRELALGGATRSLLQQMTVPVLLSH